MKDFPIAPQSTCHRSTIRVNGWVKGHLKSGQLEYLTHLLTQMALNVQPC